MVSRPIQDATLLASAGRNHTAGAGANIPVHRASTIVFPSQQAYDDGHEDIYRQVCYGALGTANAFALTQAVAELEGGVGAAVTSSGLAACTHAILPFVATGDHILVCDSVYGPTRAFCEGVLRRFGVETTYYNPRLTDITSLFRANTRLVFTEAPGSLTFEMQDIPALAAQARSHGCLTLMDNTWASPLYFKPLDYGVDISIQAATKYIGGHSDVVLGIITARTEENFYRLKDSLIALGEIASPDDCYLALRGLRTLKVRMDAQYESALTLASWLQNRSEVEQVLYPPLPGAPGHELWQRDFSGGGSVFGVLLPPIEAQHVAAMIDNYRHFSIGASWGGYESLVITARPQSNRTVCPWDAKGRTLIRFSVGLEDTQDLMADLEEGFERLRISMG